MVILLYDTAGGPFSQDYSLSSDNPEDSDLADQAVEVASPTEQDQDYQSRLDLGHGLR
jgi:hypothetical protein